VDTALASGLISGLMDVLGPGGLLLDPAERLGYGYDNSRREALPDAVALPTSREQVLAIVGLCRQHGTPITARGRGTNTTGASVPVEGGLVVSFERMNRILEIRPGDRVEIMEPGLLNGDLQKALRAHGLFWPPDPTSAPYCTIGGNLACTRRTRMVHMAPPATMCWLTAITGAGEIVRFGSQTRQRLDLRGR
jgi:D-lactate dehydrogenase